MNQNRTVHSVHVKKLMIRFTSKERYSSFDTTKFKKIMKMIRMIHEHFEKIMNRKPSIFSNFETRQELVVCVDHFPGSNDRWSILACFWCDQTNGLISLSSDLQKMYRFVDFTFVKDRKNAICKRTKEPKTRSRS